MSLSTNPRRSSGAFIGTVLGGALGYFLLSYRMRLWLRGTEYASESLSMAVLAGAFIGLTIGALLAPYSLQKTSSRSVTPYGVVMSLLVVFVWLIPMSLTGILNTSLLDVPAALRNQYRISCLFTHSSKTWQTIHYEVRVNGQLSWKEGPLEGFFDIDIFGHRTRFNRIMLASKNKDRKSRLRRKEVASYIVKRWGTVFPLSEPVKEIRIVQVSNPVGGEHCMARGPWTRPNLSEIPKKQRRQLVAFKVTGEQDIQLVEVE
jgi:hypothetical protein